MRMYTYLRGTASKVVPVSIAMPSKSVLFCQRGSPKDELCPNKAGMVRNES